MLRFIRNLLTDGPQQHYDQLVAWSEIGVDLRGPHWLECICLSEDLEKSLIKTHRTGMALSVYSFL